jgi:hypothetical protein
MEDGVPCRRLDDAGRRQRHQATGDAPQHHATPTVYIVSLYNFFGRLFIRYIGEDRRFWATSIKSYEVSATLQFGFSSNQ